MRSKINTTAVLTWSAVVLSAVSALRHQRCRVDDSGYTATFTTTKAQGIRTTDRSTFARGFRVSSDAMEGVR